jgi:hypothetical protein
MRKRRTSLFRSIPIDLGGDEDIPDPIDLADTHWPSSAWKRRTPELDSADEPSLYPIPYFDGAVLGGRYNLEGLGRGEGQSGDGSGMAFGMLGTQCRQPGERGVGTGVDVNGATSSGDVEPVFEPGC